MKDFVIENGVLKKYQGSGGAVVIPNSVTSIGANAFFGCKSLTSVTIPDSVKSIGKYAFAWCESLTSVTIPDSVTSIGGCAFAWCESLTSVTIPDSMTNIGDGAFDVCSSLTAVTYRGLKFPKEGINHIDKIMYMVENRNFSMKMNHDVKYSVIWSFYSHNPEDEPTIAYIKKNFAKMFQYLIDHDDDAETVTAIINSGKFLTKRNIDKHIQYAIDNQKYEIQVLLMDYKADKIGYSDPMAKFKL